LVIDLLELKEQELMHILFANDQWVWSELVKRNGELFCSILFQFLKNTLVIKTVSSQRVFDFLSRVQASVKRRACSLPLPLAKLNKYCAD
jgi:hypothetical protein